MSMVLLAQGRIAHGNLGPQEDFVNRNRDGKIEQDLFRRTHVFVSDRYASPRMMEDGSTRPASHLVQLIFDSGPRHEKIFSWLRPGRLISFRGRLTHRSRAYFDKEDLDETGKPKLKVHPNPTVYIERIDFLDSPIEHTAERFLNALIEGGKIPEDKKNEMVAFLKENFTYEDTRSEKKAEKPPEEAEAEVKAVEEDDPFDV